MTDRRQEDFDRDFRAMVSGLEMDDADPPEPAPTPTEPPDLRAASSPPADEPDMFNLSAALEEAGPEEPDPAEYTPPPLPPMRRPRGWAALGWVLAAYVATVLVLTIVGVRLPGWAGWLAVVAFVAAILIGWRMLPKHRDPDDDGAIV